MTEPITPAGLSPFFADCNDPQGEARHARATTGLANRSEQRARMELVGPDRVAFFDGQCTQHVAPCGNGEGGYGFVLEPKGKLVTDLTFLAREDRLLLDLPASRSERLTTWLSRYAMLTDSELINVTADTADLAIAGPAADAALSTASGFDVAVPDDEYAAVDLQIAGVPIIARRDRITGTAGLALRCAATDAATVARAIVEAGVRPICATAFDILRTEAGRPEFGGELAENVLPLESGQAERAVSFTKGCYCGQEVVAHQNQAGTPRKRLVGLLVDAAARAGDIVTRDGKEIGELGTVHRSPTLERDIALAVLKGDEHAPGTEYVVVHADVVAGAESHGVATIAALPFVT
ncbi:MAG: hypothetical protein CMJ83_14470 [Planctomycetes bacterium]|nr:hypothetical protein [Planctomycetota bacterium]